MSKIICDVCGTRYPASAEQCPICGRVDPAAAKAEAKEVENAYGRTHSQTKGGHFSKSNVKKRTKGAPIVEVPEEPEKEELIEVEEEAVETEEKKKSGCLINFLLVMVILALLAASAYIAVQYVMPEVVDRFLNQENVATEPSTDPSTEPSIEMPTETTEAPTVPCTDLVILESIIMIDEVGQSYLLNAAVAPENTTDPLMFVSADESIATVTEDGRVTSVAPGNTVITVSCGEFSVECTVVSAPGEITVPTGSDGEVETTAPTEATGEGDTDTTQPTTATKPALKDVTLSVKSTDVTFVHRGQQATFKLTCNLKPTEVTWTSQDEGIISVDENGVATCNGYGTTNVIVSYGDQEVTIIVRCIKK